MTVLRCCIGADSPSLRISSSSLVRLQTVRTLVDLSPSEKDRMGRLEEAAGVLAAAPPGAYPPLELRWLVSHAWNRGATHARFCRYEVRQMPAIEFLWDSRVGRAAALAEAALAGAAHVEPRRHLCALLQI